MSNDSVLHHSGAWPRFDESADLSGDDHNPFFARAADGRYYDIACELHLDEPMTARGIATADVDGDGLLDFAVASQWRASRFYRNTSTRAGRSIELRILRATNGATAPRVMRGLIAGIGTPLIGASAAVRVASREGVLIDEVDGGNGHSGKRSPELHFGLGKIAANAPITALLRWRGTDARPHAEQFTLTPGLYTVVLPAKGAM